MGSVIPLKKSANSAYLELKNLLGSKLEKVEDLIEVKLESDVNLIEKMSEHHLKSGGKRLRALLTLGSAKLSGYELGDRDINLASCVELIHSATLLHDDVIDESSLRRGVKTTNSIWGNQSSILVGDYLLSRCFEIMVDDGDLEILKLLSSTSAKIAQGEVLQLQHKGEADLLEDTYIDIINLKTASLFSAATKTGACLAKVNGKEKKAPKLDKQNTFINWSQSPEAINAKIKGEKVKYQIELWARDNGIANTENKYDFPPPVDNDLFFGNCLLVNYDMENNTHKDISKPEWKAIYEKLFGGFEDLNEEVVTGLGKALGSEAIDRGIENFIIGRDGRLSSPMIFDWLCSGVLSTGCNVIDIGLSLIHI